MPSALAGLIVGNKLQTQDATVGMSVSYRWGGFAFTSLGEIYVQDLGAAAVPAGSTRGGGLAFGPDGRLYVTTDAPTPASNRGQGLVTRPDGALHVSTGAVEQTDSVGEGIARAVNGALRTTAGFLPTQLSNLAAWFRFNTGVAASQWDDASGNGRHLKQATATNQPAVQGDGSLLFDGNDNFMKCDAFTLNQPETVYFLGKQITWANRNIFSGNASGSGLDVFQSGGASPQIAMFAGTTAAANENFAVGAYAAMAAVFNGASSLLQINNTTPTTGNAGAENAGGFALGQNRLGGAFSNIQVKEVIIYSAAHDAATRATVIAYLGRVGNIAVS